MRRFELRQPTSALALRVAVIVLLSASLARPLAAYDFGALTTLAEGALQGKNVNQPIAGFEIRLLQNGGVIYHQSFGSWSLDRPARVDSSTKTLAGALIMSLSETGEMGFSLDSRLSDFLAAYDKPVYRDITIRQAFSHTSGFEGQGLTSLILANPNITLQQAAGLLSLKPLVNGPPGSTFAYGGLSMHAAGAAAEVAADQDFIDLFAERITTPLGMSDTRFAAASDTNPRVSGGVESTATDFARFMDMLLNDGVDRPTGTTVLDAASVATMFQRQTTDEMPIANSPVDNNRYGIGVWLNQLGQAGPTVDALAAGARGFHSWIDESEGLVFTFATDLTLSTNVDLLSSIMHAAILQAVTLPGDFDFDVDVDGRDFLRWQRGESPVSLGALDLDAWEGNYGAVAPPSATLTAVPEPSTWITLVLGVLSSYFHKWRRFGKLGC